MSRGKARRLVAVLTAAAAALSVTWTAAPEAAAASAAASAAAPSQPVTPVPTADPGVTQLVVDGQLTGATDVPELAGWLAGYGLPREVVDQLTIGIEDLTGRHTDNGVQLAGYYSPVTSHIVLGTLLLDGSQDSVRYPDGTLVPSTRAVAAPAILAHEIGHWYQDHHPDRPDPGEHQADCVATLLMGWATGQARCTVADLEQAVLIVSARGPVEPTNAGHVAEDEELAATFNRIDAPLPPQWLITQARAAAGLTGVGVPRPVLFPDSPPDPVPAVLSVPVWRPAVPSVPPTSELLARSTDRWWLGYAAPQDDLIDLRVVGDLLETTWRLVVVQDGMVFIDGALDLQGPPSGAWTSVTGLLARDAGASPCWARVLDLTLQGLPVDRATASAALVDASCTAAQLDSDASAWAASGLADASFSAPPQTPDNATSASSPRTTKETP